MDEKCVLCLGKKFAIVSADICGNLDMVTHYMHPKLRNANLHNVTHFLRSQNLMERMFVVQISLVIVTFLSLRS